MCLSSEISPDSLLICGVIQRDIIEAEPLFIFILIPHNADAEPKQAAKFHTCSMRRMPSDNLAPQKARLTAVRSLILHQNTHAGELLKKKKRKSSWKG